jgi:hypothetical protein
VLRRGGRQVEAKLWARRPAESMVSGGELGDEVLRGGRAPPPNRARRSSDRARRRVRGEQGEVREALTDVELECRARQSSGVASAAHPRQRAAVGALFFTFNTLNRWVFFSAAVI